VAEKDIQIKALTGKKTFWKRFETTLKDVGIGVAIGAVAASVAHR
jgi:hypothetical protein